MIQLHIKTLSQIGNQEILNCFNTSFSDYSIPLKLNLEQLETKLKTESVDKTISVGAFKGNNLIGLVLHGSREIKGVQIAYNAGTGVVPSERGKALTKKMYDFIQPILKERGFKEVVLEVISNNTPAITSYIKIGFKAVRDLTCYKGRPFISRVNGEVEVKRVRKVHFGDLEQIAAIEPTWQNSKETILKLGENAHYFLAYREKEFCGFCILNTTNHRILQIAVKKEYRNSGIGTTLLEYATGKTLEPVSIINVDSRFRSMLNFLENRNLQRTVDQIEMKLMINNG